MKSLTRTAFITGTLLLAMLGMVIPANAQQHETRNTQEHQQRQTQRQQHGRQNEGRLSTRNERRISQDRFRENFGRDHYFHVNEGEFRAGYFGFGGFNFGFVDPWPIAWSYNDDVYVDDIDGTYFLLDPRFPSDRVEVVVQ